MKTNTRTIQKFYNKREVEHQKLSNGTKRRYQITLQAYSKYHNKPLKQLLQEAEEEQIPYINNKNQIIIPQPENTQLYDNILDYLDYCKEKGRMIGGIDSDLRILKVFHRTFNIKFPNINLDKPHNKLRLLRKNDIKIILENTYTRTRNLYLFLMTTGMRISDACNITIEDFIEALGLDNIDDILTHNLENIGLGYWEFTPQKTRNTSGIICKTCTTVECNRHLLVMLKQRHNNTPLTLNQPLFTTQYGNKYNPVSISGNAIRVNKRVHKILVNKYKTQYEHNMISEKKYKELIEDIPKFHCHGLRKYFISVLANHGVPERVSAVMEGHVPPISTDTSYVDISRETIMREYFRIVPYLTIEPTEVQVLKDKDKQRLDKMVEEISILKGILKDKKKLNMIYTEP